MEALLVHDVLQIDHVGDLHQPLCIDADLEKKEKVYAFQQ